MHSLPAAGNINRLASSPLIVPGVNQNGTIVSPLAAANISDNAPGLGLAGAGLLGFDGANWHRLTAAAAGDQEGAAYNLWTANSNKLFNGLTWDRERGNENRVVLAPAVRSTSTQSPIQNNFNARGAYFYFDVTAVPGVDTVAFSVLTIDPASGNFGALISAGPTAAAGLQAYVLYPGALTTIVGLTAGTIGALPRTFFINIAHSGPGAFTYSVGVVLIL